MDKFKLTIASILAFAGAAFLPTSLNATDPGTPTSGSKETELKILKPQFPNRPRVPSNQVIHIVFNPATEECFFELPNGINHVSVEVICEETGFSFYDEVYALNPVALIPMTTGTYTIICTTDDGETFSGTLYI